MLLVKRKAKQKIKLEIKELKYPAFIQKKNRQEAFGVYVILYFRFMIRGKRRGRLLDKSRFAETTQL